VQLIDIHIFLSPINQRNSIRLTELNGGHWLRRQQLPITFEAGRELRSIRPHDRNPK
jgi:hypothetical protein